MLDFSLIVISASLFLFFLKWFSSTSNQIIRYEFEQSGIKTELSIKNNSLLTQIQYITGKFIYIIYKHSAKFLLIYLITSIIIGGILHIVYDSELSKKFLLISGLIFSVYIGGFFLGSANNDEIDKPNFLSEFDFSELLKRVKTVGEDIKSIFFANADSIKFSGFIEIPNKFYANESDNIYIYLEGEKELNNFNHEKAQFNQIDDVNIVELMINKNEKDNSYLRVELQAASLKINGNSIQEYNLKNNILKYHWSISSDKTTLHKIKLIFSKVSNSTIDLLRN